MNQKIKLLIEYKSSKSDEVFNKLLLELKYIIIYYLKKVSFNYKKEMEQEILIVIYKLCIDFKPSIEESLNFNYFTLSNLKLLKEANYQNIKIIFNNHYLEGFIRKYGDELFIKSFYDIEIRKIFIMEFCLFCNENRLIKYLKKRLNYLFNDYKRKENRTNLLLWNDIKIYPKIENNHFQPIDLISILGNKKLSKKEIKFLLSFIEDGRFLSEIELSKKLGISQQAVNKRKRLIIKKYMDKS